MKIVLIALSGYAAASFLLYFVLRAAHARKKLVFKAPKDPFLFYLLSFTWGAPMTLIGCFPALFALLRGFRPLRTGCGLCFCSHDAPWGVSLGPFCFLPRSCGNDLLTHEIGHGVQNVWLGFFMPAVVALPSFLRFRARAFSDRVLKRGHKKGYEAIWFEKSASESGASARIAGAGSVCKSEESKKTEIKNGKERSEK